MKNLFHLFLFLFLIILFSCAKDTPTTTTTKIPPVVIHFNEVEITRDIDSPVTWTYGNTYIIRKNFTVRSTLTIEPGVVIKMEADKILMFSTFYAGKLIADGTEDRHIIFTSLRDDAHGGDNNADGTKTTAAKGDWEYMEFDNTKGCILRYCELLYAGKANGAGQKAIDFYEHSVVTIDHCTIAHTRGGESTMPYAIFCFGMDSGSTITNCIFYDNDKPIRVPNWYTLDNSNTFHNPANTSQKNKQNAVYYLGGTFNKPITINETEVPTVFETLTNQFTTGGSLTMADNTVLKIKETGKISIPNKTDLVFGANTFITSSKDDEHGGDSNGDLNTTSPYKGDWDGVYIANSSSYLAAANLLYSAH
ncbi:MAG: hypothetical protein NTX03_15060 [Bacteroidetes bacterium]|nr:hypothetical protein [Bacteroidota bacterium]